MTFSRFNSHSNPLFHKLNLLKFEDIFKFRVAMLTYDTIKNNTNKFNTNILQLDSIHNHNTRSKSNNNCYIPQVRTRLGASSLNYKSPIIWNQVPIEIKNCLSLNIFKSNYRTYLMNKY